MQSTFLTSLILAVILTPIFNGISFFINPLWQKKLTLLASLLAAFASTTLLVLIVRNPELASQSITLSDWISIHGKTSFVLPIQFQVTLLATLFLTMSNFLFSLLIFFQNKNSLNSEERDHVLFYSSWAVGFSNLFLISDNLYLSFGLLELVTLMIYLVGNYSQKKSTNALFNRKLFLNIHFFNLLLLITFIFIHSHFQTSTISGLLNQTELINSLKADSPSVLFVISFLLLISVAGRAGQFPLFSWSELVSRQTAFVSSLIQTVTLAPISFYLLLRLYPLIIESSQACFLVSVLGILTVLLVGLISVFQKKSSLSLGYLISGVWGIFFCSLSLSRVDMWGNLTFFLLSAFPMITLILLISEWVNESTEEKTDSIISASKTNDLKGVKTGLLIAVLFLFTGLSSLSLLVEPFGENLFNFDQAGSHSEFDQAGSHSENLAVGTQEWTMFGLQPHQLMNVQYIFLLLGNYFISLAAFRLFLKLARSNDLVTNNQYSSRNGFLCVASFLLLSIGVWALGYWVTGSADNMFVLGETSFKMGIPFQAGLIQLVSGLGAASAWVLFYKKDEKTVSMNDGSFQRMCRNRFYIEDVIFLGLLLPIRGVGQLSRFFDWLIIDGILVTLPSKVLKKIVWFYEPLESAEMPFPLVAMLSAVAVMFITLCWFL